MLGAGYFNDRVSILEPVMQRGENGEQDTTWVEKARVRAKVQFNRGVQALTVAESWMQQQITVTMRATGEVQDNDRIVWQHRQYNIESLNRDKANHSITIVCTKVDEGSDNWVLADGRWNMDGQWKWAGKMQDVQTRK